MPQRTVARSSPTSSLLVGETSSLLANQNVLTSSSVPERQEQQHHHHSQQHHGTASVVETIINETKTCFGTGVLALPYAARVGGIFLHVMGLFAIGLWNVYSVHRLCQCLQLLPKEVLVSEEDDNDGDEEESSTDDNEGTDANNVSLSNQQQQQQDTSQTVLELSSSHQEECHHRHTASNNSTATPLTTSIIHGPCPYNNGTSSQFQQHLQSPSSSQSCPNDSTTHRQRKYSMYTHLHHFKIESSHRNSSNNSNNHLHPPRGTSTYSRVAWYAFGPVGLAVLDLMMASLFIGVVVAFVDAIRGFLRDTPVTTGSNALDALFIALVIGPMSAVPDIGYLSRASATGLVVLFASFVVIAVYGIVFVDRDSDDRIPKQDYDTADDTDDMFAVSSSTTTTIIQDNYNYNGGSSGLNWFPKSGIEGISQWFGIVVFGYGIAPLTYNFKESMADPSQMVRASTIALLIVAGTYVILGVGLYALFPDIDGDVLHTLPAEGWLPIVTRLSMAVVVFVTAPLLIVPCGQLIEGKILKTSSPTDEIPYAVRAGVRIGIALLCVSISVLVPGFVSVLGLVGCASVAVVGFVVPPLLFLRLRLQHSLWSWDMTLDLVMLLWGTIATGISTNYAFRTAVSSKL